MEVRVLPIRIIAKLWAEEREMDQAILEQELRLSVINYPRYMRGKGLINPIPPKDEWPSADEVLDREHIYWFGRKQRGWPLPEFWFGPQPKEKRKPGRPPLNMNAIVQEFRRRLEAGEAKKFNTEEARDLCIWFAKAHPNEEKKPSIRYIENVIGKLQKKK